MVRKPRDVDVFAVDVGVLPHQSAAGHIVQVHGGRVATAHHQLVGGVDVDGGEVWEVTVHVAVVDRGACALDMQEIHTVIGGETPNDRIKEI